MSHAASYECGGKLSDVEKIICGNSELSSFDEELGSLYKYMSVSNVNRKEQLSWLKSRNNCKETLCITESYKKRIETLKFARIPISKCLTNINEIKQYQDENNYHQIFTLDSEVEQSVDEDKIYIFISSGCGTVGCNYLVYKIIKGCVHEISSFQAREYYYYKKSEINFSNYFNESEISRYREAKEISDICSGYIVANVSDGSSESATPEYALYCLPSGR